MICLNLFLLTEDDSELCVFPHLYIFDLWCTKEGTHRKKLKEVINTVQCNIENSGHMPIVTELTESVEKICKQIVNFWTRYNRKKASFLKYQCEWLNHKKTILLICNHNISEKIMESDHRGRPKNLDAIIKIKALPFS